MTAILEAAPTTFIVPRLSWPVHVQVKLSLSTLAENSRGLIDGSFNSPLPGSAALEATVELRAPLEGAFRLLPNDDEEDEQYRLSLWKPANCPEAADVHVHLGAGRQTLAAPLLAWFGRYFDKAATNKLSRQLQGALEAALERRLGLNTLDAWSHSGPLEPLHSRTVATADPSPDALPPTEPLKTTITLEIQFPLLDRRQARNPSSFLANSNIPVTADGALLIETEGIPQSRQPVAACAIAPAAGLHALRRKSVADLRFQDERRLPVPRARWLLELLTNLYEIDFDWKWLQSLDGEVDVVLALRLDGKAASSWYTVPDENSFDFFLQLAPASEAMQRTARAWFSYLYFLQPDPLQVWNTAAALLAHQCLRTYTGRARWNFSYDVLEPKPILTATRRLSKPIRQRLATMDSWIRRYPKDVIKRFRPTKSPDMVAAMREIPRPFAALLSGEKFLADDLAGYALQCRRLKKEMEDNPAEAPTGLRRLGETIEKHLRIRLRHMCPSIEGESLTSLILIAATQALAHVQGAPARLDAMLEVWHPASGQRRIALNRLLQPPGAGQ